MASNDSMSLPMAIRKHLSLPGETASDLMKQIRELSDKDKDDLVRYFGEQGIEVTRTAAATAAGA